ncbi:hypothetical protein IFM89_009446 [Coptis chinensis]|uniref:T-complex protein 1 subunit delta n=1 Tax=Coptis chinensis TaxID=261450 RepID=A0A835I8S1_9MAGN|nr:hypothetical protein IFM89_009446 [Coptis chinensis]
MGLMVMNPGCWVEIPSCRSHSFASIAEEGDRIHVDLVDLRDVKIVKKLGGTVDDLTELVKGLVLIRRILKEERNYILGMIKKIKGDGCNVLLIQKSILRDAVTDLSLHYLSKAKILVVKDVERDAIEFITKTLNCLPIANIEHFREEKMGRADCVEEVLIAGGGAPEIELSRQLGAWAKVLHGMESYCVRSFAEALEVIPYTLAENAGQITNILEENVVHPALVSTVAITLATESREDDHED